MSASTIREEFTGSAIMLFEDNIDTDRILPARYLKELSFDGYGRHVFESDRSAAGGSHPFDDPANRGAKVLVSRTNFGTGSSREGAPQALMHWGIEIVIAVSFGEIFRGNAAAIGVPCVTITPADIDELAQVLRDKPGATVSISLDDMRVTVTGRSWPVRLDETQREMFRSGNWDTLSVLLTALDGVRAVAHRMPYLNAWES